MIDGAGLPVPEGGRQPWRLDGPWTTPVVIAVQGWCITIGIELLLAADVRIASADTRFAQLEVQRGIYPFAGATIRMPREAGWGNAMKHLLTGDPFDAAEAHRMGLVQEVVAAGHAARARGRAGRADRDRRRTARRRARRSRSAYRAMYEGHDAAVAQLQADAVPLFASEDGAEGMRSFVERRPARFSRALSEPHTRARLLGLCGRLRDAYPRGGPVRRALSLRGLRPRDSESTPAGAALLARQPVDDQQRDEQRRLVETVIGSDHRRSSRSGMGARFPRSQLDSVMVRGRRRRRHHAAC